MADIFSTAPPAWLTNIAQPISGEKLGTNLGLLAASLQKSIVNANKDESDPTRENKSLSDYWMESKLNLTDPLWREKADALHTQNQLRNMALRDAVTAQTEVANWLKDSGGDPQWMTDHPYTGSNPVAARQINMIQQQAARSTIVKTATDAAITNAKLKAKDAELYNQGLNALDDPIERSAIQQMNPSGPPLPEQFKRLELALRKEHKAVPWIKEIMPVSTPGKIQYDRQKLVESGATPEQLAEFDRTTVRTGGQLREKSLYNLADEFRAKGDTRNADAMERVARHESTVADEKSLVSLETSEKRNIFKLQAEIAGLEKNPRLNRDEIAKKRAELESHQLTLNSLTEIQPAPTATPAPNQNQQPMTVPDYKNWLQNRANMTDTVPQTP